MILTTERLTLRQPVLADFDAFAAMLAEPYVNKFITGKPQTLAEAWARFLRNSGGWTLTGMGFFLIFDRQTDQFLGQTGFFQGMREIGPDFDDAYECGWMLTQAAAGRGLATEAVLAAHDWFDAQSFARCTVCMIDPAHRASLRVAHKAGYALFRSTRDELGAVDLLRRPAALR